MSETDRITSGTGWANVHLSTRRSHATRRRHCQASLCRVRRDPLPLTPLVCAVCKQPPPGAEPAPLPRHLEPYHLPPPPLPLPPPRETRAAPLHSAIFDSDA